MDCLIFNISQMIKYGSALNSTVTSVEELIKLTDGLTLKQTLNILSTKELSAEDLKSILIKKGMTEADAEATAAKMANNAATNAGTISVKAYSTALLSSIKDFALWLTTNPVGIIIGITTAIIAAITIIEKATKTIKEQKEEIKKLQSEYEEISSEVDDFNSKIKETSDRIAELYELQKNGTITLVEQDELKKLNLTNQLLKEQLLNKEALEDIKEKELQDANRETFDNEYKNLVSEEPLDMSYKKSDYTDPRSDYDNFISMQIFNAKEQLEKGKFSDNAILIEIRRVNEAIDDAISLGDRELEIELSGYLNVLKSKLSERSDVIIESLLEYQSTLSDTMNEDGTFDDKLDQQMWNQIENIKKYIYENSNRSGEWNTLQFDAALNDESLVDLKEQLVERLNNGELTTEDIKGIQELNDAFEDCNLIVGKFETPASLFIKYLQGIEYESDKAKNSISFDANYMKTKDEIIDQYQSDVNTLYEAYKKISNGNLSSNDLVDLLEQFPELTNKTDDLGNAIDILVDSKLTSLKDSLKELGVTDEELVLFDEMTNEIKNININDVLSNIKNVNSLISDINVTIADSKKISTDTLQSIISQYPDLEDEVNNYLQGKLTEVDLLDLLKEKYNTDVSNYKQYYLSKYSLDNEFYNRLVSNLSDDIKQKAKAYDIDFNNYANLCTAKLELAKELAKREATINFATKSLGIMDIVENDDGFDKNIFMSEGMDRGLQIQKDTAQQEYNDILALIDEMNTSFEDSISLDMNLFDGTNDNSSNDSENKIDWLTNSLENLKESSDDAQRALDNTKGFDNQIKAIETLNGKLELLKNGYQNAGDEYKSRFNGYDFTKISNIVGQEKANEYYNKIKSGKIFTIEDLKDLGLDNNVASKLLDYINQSISDYQAYKDMYNNTDETINEIEKNNQEKLSFNESKYQSRLDYINEQLEDETLSEKEHNKLLDKQYDIQVKLNDIERERAEKENDQNKINKLNQEDKNNYLTKEIGKVQYKKDNNQELIDSIESQLNNTSLTQKEKKALNEALNKAILKDFQFQIDIGLLSVDENALQDAVNEVRKTLTKKQLKKYTTDDDIIKAFLPDVLNALGDSSLINIYSDMLNTEKDQITSAYDDNKAYRQYKINNNQNNITDIENAISESGGRGTKEQYATMKQLENKNKNMWENQLAKAKEMLATTVEGTEEWDKWNSEIQDCENNIFNCNSKIKECNISILSLPLNDITDELNVIQTQLNYINHEMDNQNTLISAANEILDQRIEVQNDLKEGIQDQINSLQEENSLREANLSVSKAQYELEKLKNQKTTKVYKEGQGWVYESDSDEIRNAQEEYDNAVYNQKIAILQDQLNGYDKEIDRLNKIKELWGKINTNAQSMIDINQAIEYDSDFINKVLNSDTILLGTIANYYTDLLSQKTDLDKRQYSYQELQESINNTIEKYKIESLTFEDAKESISYAIEKYNPSILKSYEEQSDKIDELIGKETNESNTIVNATSSNQTAIERSNQRIIESYNKLLENLNETFSKMNDLLSDFSDNAKDMADSVTKSINKINTLLNGTTPLLKVLNGVSAIDAANKGVFIGGALGAIGLTKVGESHTGMELGYVSKSMDNGSSSRDDFQTLCLEKLEPNEILRKLEIGESVITAEQRDRLMGNFNTMTNTLTHIPFRNVDSNKSVNFNGDIVVNGVQDTDSFAKAVKSQLPNILLQEIYKK